MTVPIHAKVSWVVYAKRKKIYYNNNNNNNNNNDNNNNDYSNNNNNNTKKKVGLKVMLHGTICNDDFQRKTALQHCCDIVSNGCNIVPTLQRCVALKIVVANRPV